MSQPRRQLQLSARARGIGLIDALIALAILSFGLLALTRFQTRTVAQTTEAQERLTAVQFGDELLSTVLVDAGNANCYTLPQAGACASATAQAIADDWKTRAEATLPGGATAGSVIAGDQMTVTLTWTGKESQDARTLQVTTDVRDD